MSLTVRRSKNKKNRRAGGQTDAIGILHRDMQDLMELQKAQETKFVPEVKDVPRMRIKQGAIHNVELSYITTVGLNSAAPTFGALNFQLQNAANYASYTACFDQYRIMQVNVKIIPIGVAVTGGNTFYTVLDYDDSTAPTAVATYLGYATLQVTPSGIITERTLAPRTATAAYNGTFSGYANMPSSQWIDAASPGVQYYGLKYYTPQASAATSVQFIVTMVVQFRAQRST